MDLEIKYNNGQGHMLIHMEVFFPTSQVRFKKFLKVVDLDYEHRDDHIDKMKQFFKDRYDELEETRTSVGKKHLDYKQKVSDQQKIVDSRKFPSGVRLTKEQFDQAKEDLKQFKMIAASSLAEYKRCIKQKEQFKKHLEILSERK